MRVLVLQHAPSEGPGTLGTFLESRGVDLATCRIDEGEPVPEDPGNVSAILSLGGPMSLAGESRPGFFAAETALLSEALRREIPVLGICLGAQILARACGAGVSRAPRVEVGWSRVRLTPEGLRDPLFCGVPERFDAFQWHGDTFDIPSGGARIVEGDTCRNQAFRWGRSAYGLQFHVEATPEMIQEWYDAGGLSRPAPPPFRPSMARTAQILYLNFLGNILYLRPAASPPAGEGTGRWAFSS